MIWTSRSSDTCPVPDDRYRRFRLLLGFFKSRAWEIQNAEGEKLRSPWKHQSVSRCVCVCVCVSVCVCVCVDSGADLFEYFYFWLQTKFLFREIFEKEKMASNFSEIWNLCRTRWPPIEPTNWNQLECISLCRRKMSSRPSIVLLFGIQLLPYPEAIDAKWTK